MTDLIQRLRDEPATELELAAADRIEQLEDEAGQLREQNTYLDGVVAKLEKRLEISPRTKYDGIDCRDETIRQLERENAELESKLAKAEHDLFHANAKLESITKVKNFVEWGGL